MKPSQSPQPIFSQASSSSGTVASTCEWIARSWRRKKPSAGVEGARGQHQRLRAHLAALGLEHDLAAAAHALHERVLVECDALGAQHRSHGLEQREAVEAPRERVEHGAVCAVDAEATLGQVLGRDAGRLQLLDVRRRCLRAARVRVHGQAAPAAEGAGRSEAGRERLGDVDAAARGAVHAAASPRACGARRRSPS